MRALTVMDSLAIFAVHQMVRRDRPVSVGEIARAVGRPLGFVKAVFQKLRDAGFIRARPGLGYTLARAPGDISILDLVRTLETPKAPESPCGGDYDACDSRAACVLAPLCRRANENFQSALRSFTLQDLRQVSPDLPNCLDPRIASVDSKSHARSR